MPKKRKNREKIILATKVAGPGCNWIRGGGNNFNEKTIGEAINGSLKRLKTDYIEDILVDLKACLDSDKYPKSGQDCDNCRWYNEKKKLSDEIRSKIEKK